MAASQSAFWWLVMVPMIIVSSAAVLPGTVEAFIQLWQCELR